MTKQATLAEQLESGIAKVAARRRKDRDRAFATRSLTWLALAPLWPVELAKEGFPATADSIATGKAVEDLLERVVAEALGDVVDDTLWQEGVLRFNASARDSVLKDVASEKGLGLRYLREQLIESAQQMAKSAGDRLKADPRLDQWVKLATVADDDEALSRLLERSVDEAIERARALQHLTAPRAAEWIRSATPISRMFAGLAEITLMQCERKLELFHRRSHDIRMLQNYFVRDEYDRAFEELLADDRRWALHFIGVGGTGKTMTLRHITHGLAKKHDVAIARVDFDYLNPDYPFRAPGLLLIELSEELRLQASPQVERLFVRFDEAARAVKDKIRGAFHSGEPILPTTSDKEFVDALMMFAEALHGLGSKQPVLILDTCEELAKLRSDGTSPDNVVVTFEILEKLHDLVPQLRVVFSGRRELPSHEYLRRCRVRGFSRPEAEKFLWVYDIDGDRVAPSLREPILELTKVTGADADERHNPYDLDLYASWAVAESELALDKLLEGGGHHYVEERIVGRLTSEIRGVLRLVVLLGRFDRALLESLLADRPNQDALIQEVTSLEFVEPDRGGSRSWRVDSVLREKLLVYYRDVEPAALTNAKANVAALMQVVTLERPFSRLNPQHFAAALHSLADQPARAARWWRQVEHRCSAKKEWAWNADMIQTLLGEPGLGKEGAMSMRSAALATLGSCQLHLGRSNSDAWAEVLQHHERLPAKVDRERYRIRGEYGLAAAWSDAAALDSPSAPSGAVLQDEELGAAYVAALEAFTESAERAAPTLSVLETAVGDATAFVERTKSREILAPFARSLRARLKLLLDPGSEETDFRAALETFGDDERASPTYLDWVAPPICAYRVKLEFARALPTLRTDTSTIPTLEALQVSRVGSLDGDRLATVLLESREAQVHPAVGVSPEVLQEQRAVALHAPMCNAHRYVAPYFLSGWWARGRAGDVGPALHQLSDLSREAEESGRLDVVLAADRVVCRIIHRMRLQSEGLDLPSSVQASPLEQDVRMARRHRWMYSDPDEAESQQEPARIEWGAPGVRGPRSDAEHVLAWTDWTADDAEAKDSLRTATQAFHDCGDALSALLTEISLALANCRSSDAVALRDSLSRIEELYQRVGPLLGEDRPSWLQLHEAAQNASVGELLDGLGPPPSTWRPWLARLLGCILCELEPTGGPGRTDLVAWLSQNHGSTTSGQTVLPRDLEFLRLEPLTTGGVSGAKAWAGRIKDTAVVLLGLAYLAAFLYGTYWGLGWIMGQLSLRTDWTVRVPTYVGVGMLLGLVPIVVSPLLTAAFGLVRVALQFDYSEAPDDPNEPLASPGRVTFRSELRLPPFTRSLPTQTGTVAASDGREYTDLVWEAFPGSSALGRLQRSVLRGFKDIQVIVDERSAGGAWEAFISLSTGPMGTFSKNRFRFRRTTSTYRSGVEPRWVAPLRMRVVCDPSASGGLLQEIGGFERAFVGYDKVRIVRDRFEGPHDGTSGEVGVLYLCAVPLDTPSGLRLKSNLDKHVDEQQLIRPREILESHKMLRLVVIQAPILTGGARLQGDRREAAKARRIGAELFEAGLPAVLIVPPIPLGSTRVLLEGLARLIRRGRGRSTPGLVRLARRVQDSVVAELPDLAEATEVAFDVCLYASNDLDLKVNRR